MLGWVMGLSMRQGITVQVSEGDRVRLAAIVADRNRPQKHVWRARIVLMTADGVGTNTIIATDGQEQGHGVALAGAFHGARGRRAGA